MGSAGRAGARARKLSRPPNCSGRFIGPGVYWFKRKSIIRLDVLVESAGAKRARDRHRTTARPPVAKRAMGKRLHLQGCVRRHGDGTWLRLSTLVHYSSNECIDCQAGIERKILRRTLPATG